jgi:hypothetical protein
MNDRHAAQCQRMSAHDLQVPTVDYLPAIAFAAVLIATTIPRPLRRQLRAEPR